MAAASTVIAVAAIASAAVAAGGTAYSIKSSEDAKSDARKQAKKQEDAAAQKDREMRGRMADEEAQRTNAETQAKARERQKAIGGQSRRDTILTSPLGVTGEPDTAGKTLLGA